MTAQPQPSTTNAEPTATAMGEPASPAVPSTDPATANIADTTPLAGSAEPAPYAIAGPGSYRTTAAGPYGPQTRWQPLPPATDYRMRRSGTDRMLAGVCGGIAEHTDIDPVYIRLAFLVSAFWGGIGVIAYIAAAIIMPRPLP